MILCDKQIARLAKEHDMINPYSSKLSSKGVISYGQSSYGYDLSLSDTEFKLFIHRPGNVVDPKNFDDRCLVDAELFNDETGTYFIMPSSSYALGISKEYLRMPNDITAIAVGKSTYARSGIDVCVTPIEAGWCGNVVLEFSNDSNADCKIYANEGVVQLIFFRGVEVCETSYKSREGKYQDQRKITYSKVK